MKAPSENICFEMTAVQVLSMSSGDISTLELIICTKGHKPLFNVIIVNYLSEATHDLSTSSEAIK